MFAVEPLTLASQDIEEIYQWYEDRKFGLGDAFLDALDERFEEIGVCPFLCTVLP